MNKEIYLSIVIPAYKEEKRIHQILDAIVKYKKTTKKRIETIVVSDGSPDNLSDAVKKYQGKIDDLIYIDRKINKGKGYTVRQGIMKAMGKYILFSDADNSTPIEQVDKLLKYRGNRRVIIGSRYVKGGKLTVPQSFTRRIGSRVLNLIIRLFAVRGIKDTQCGFKLFEQSVAKEIFSRQTFEKWSFDIEILAIARKLGYKIIEVGITWHADPHSVLNPLKAGLQIIKDSWVVRKNLISNKYK